MRQVIPIVPVLQVAPGAPKDSVLFPQLPPLSLYIHFPWCVRKCPYCDFNSHAVPVDGHIPEEAYLQALIEDLESALPDIWGRKVVSIFMGGGTPSLISASGMDRLLADIRARVPLLPGAEITMEANPGTMDTARFVPYKEAGITRLSIGIQSFHSGHLAALGRIHDPEQAKAAAQNGRETFAHLNIDLMYGLPHQTLAEALSDVEMALSFSPDHLSCYQLTIEPNTFFSSQPPSLPEADLCADMQEAIEDRLHQAGFRHYETSAFAQPGSECQHNLNYWQFGDYLGIGAGAHSKITRFDGVTRSMRWKNPKQYLDPSKAPNQSRVEQVVAVSSSDLPFEFMMNALRLTEGVPMSLFEQRCAIPLSGIASSLYEAEQAGLLSRQQGMLSPTLKGQRYLNRLLEIFLNEA